MRCEKTTAIKKHLSNRNKKHQEFIYIEGTTFPISLYFSEFQTACVGKPTELQDLPHHRLSLDLGNSTNDGRKTPVIFASQKNAAKESQIKTQTAGTVAAVQECP